MNKFSTPEPIPDSVREWMESVLIALGQMKHPPRGSVDGHMLMEVGLRTKLIHQGHNLLGYPGFPIANELADNGEK